MLNVPLLERSMRRLGLNQAALARKLGVSREAVSNWLAGEAQPRPMMLVLLCECLNLDVDEVFVSDASAEEPVVAFRTRTNRMPTTKALEAVRDMARHLDELVPFLSAAKPDFEPPVLRDPLVDEAYIARVGSQLRMSVGLGDEQTLEFQHIVRLHEDFGSVLVPVLWGGDKSGHENALSVYLPEKRISFVVFNLNCRIDDLKYWLTHELGHCYTLPKLQGEEGEEFSERLAAVLLFPEAMARQAYQQVVSAAEPLAQATFIAGLHKISVITVIKEVDRYAAREGLPTTGLDNKALYQAWRQTGAASAAAVLYQDQRPSPQQYIRCSEDVFHCEVFSALARRQREEGKSPSFVAKALHIGLKDAWILTQALGEMELSVSQ